MYKILFLNNPNIKSIFKNDASSEMDQDSTFNHDAKKVNIFDLFKTPNLRKNTLIQYFNWFTTAFVYYGLTLNADTLIPGNVYINFCVSGLIEFPAYILCLVVIHFLGRRIPLGEYVHSIKDLSARGRL